MSAPAEPPQQEMRLVHGDPRIFALDDERPFYGNLCVSDSGYVRQLIIGFGLSEIEPPSYREACRDLPPAYYE
jgi:hypothetical protein